MNIDKQEPQSQIPAGSDPNTPVSTEGGAPEAAEPTAPYAEASAETAGESPAENTAGESNEPLAAGDMLSAGEAPQVYSYSGGAATDPADPVEPPKKKFPLIPVIVGCIAVIAVAVFAFGRGGIGNPKEYLQTALKANSESFSASYAEYPNVSGRFDGPAGIDFSFTLDEATKATGSLLMDPEKSTQLWSLDVAPYTGNKLFLSPDRLALSIPGFFPAKEYITVDTATFREDWAASMFGMMSPLPADFDLNALLANTFSSSANDALLTRAGELQTDLEAASTVAREKQVTGEDGKKMEVLSCTYPPEALKAYLTGFTDFYKKTMTETFAPMGAVMGASVMESYDVLFDQMDKMEFTSPLVVQYFIADKQIKRIELLPYSASVADAYSPDTVYDYEFNMAMDLTGEKNTADKFVIDFNMKGSVRAKEADAEAAPEGSLDDAETMELQIRLTREKTVVDGVLGDTYKLEITDPTDEENSMVMDFDLQWNPALEGEDNLTAAIGMNGGYENMSYILTGSLLDTAETLAFENGRFTVKDMEYDSEDSFQFTFKIYGVTGEDVNPGITEENSINFRDITMEHLQSMYS